MTEQVTVFEANVDPGRVARETAWQLRRSHEPTPVTLWVPVVLAGCAVVLQMVALVAMLLRTL